MKVLDSISNKHKIQLSDKTYIDNDGYLVCERAIFGRVGVQQYLKGELGISGNPNDVINVYRKPEYIFDEESLETLDGKPLTLGHPKVKVNIENYQKFAKGFVQNIQHDEHNIYGDIRVTDKEVRYLIEHKKMRELSLGYDMVLLQEDGDENNYYCKDIIYNHLALVKQGRAGNAMILDEACDNFEERGNEEIPDEKDNLIQEQEVQEKEEIEKVENQDEEPKQDEESKVDEKQEQEEPKTEDACGGKESQDEEPKEESIVEKENQEEKKENKEMSFLDRALEIDKLQDEELKKALKSQLMKDMGVNVGDEKPNEKKNETTKVEINDQVEDEDISHSDKMQAYYDSFDPHLYGNNCNGKEYKDAMKDNIISRKLEDVYRARKINK